MPETPAPTFASDRPTLRQEALTVLTAADATPQLPLSLLIGAAGERAAAAAVAAVLSA